jgi:hypothetical protein
MMLSLISSLWQPSLELRAIEHKGLVIDKDAPSTVEVSE